ncbi:MAG: peroxiredoxin [Gemmataceae bacterium]|nr:peroxiredoxin [Gemmataceae bacterium]
MRSLFGLAAFAAAFAILGLQTDVFSQDKGKKEKAKAELKVKVGDAAPKFHGVDENGKTWKSEDHVGKKVLVVYFYPADFTGGCTAQACGFRDDIENLNGKGVEVVGVSGDTAETHAAFKKHHKLPFTLLADDKGDIAKTFGVPVGKGGKASFKDDGKVTEFTRGVTISRYTVVIDKDGKVAAIDAVGKAGEDPKRVADIVNKIASK